MNWKVSHPLTFSWLVLTWSEIQSTPFKGISCQLRFPRSITPSTHNILQQELACPSIVNLDKYCFLSAFCHVPHLFCLHSVYVLFMFRFCLVYVHLMFCLCFVFFYVFVPSLFRLCLVYVQFMLPLHSINIPFKFRLRLVHLPLISVYFLSTFRLCFAYLLPIFSLCSTNVPSTFRLGSGYFLFLLCVCVVYVYNMFCLLCSSY